MKPISSKISQLILAVASTFLVTQISISQAATKKVNLDRLCNKFPLNSRCRDFNYSLAEPEPTQLEIERESLCNKFPQNSNCLREPAQVTKIQLDRSGEKDEWIKLEQQENVVKVLHTTQVKDGLTSGILNGALGLVPVPLPFIEANKYNWKDHLVTGVAFQPDGCKIDHCKVTGTDTLTLPEGTDIYAGLLTVEYQEGKLKRSVTFRVPPDAKTETITSITITISDRNAWAERQKSNYGYLDFKERSRKNRP